MPSDTPAHPPTVLTRCTYAAYLGASVLALAFTALACGEGQPLLLLHTLLAATAAALFRAALAESGQLAACTQEDVTPVAYHSIPSGTLARGSAALRRRCVELESLRGTPRFDPWKTLEARRRLSALCQRQDRTSV